MKFITENWFVLVALAAVAAAGGYAVYTFVKMPTDKQLKKVREWLLYAVTKAEKELGGGTGQIKLRYVYDMFVARLTWLAQGIFFEMFSMMVDCYSLVYLNQNPQFFSKLNKVWDILI